LLLLLLLLRLLLLLLLLLLLRLFFHAGISIDVVLHRLHRVSCLATRACERRHDF
jgi:hypothetical protein